MSMKKAELIRKENVVIVGQFDYSASAERSGALSENKLT